MVARGRIYLKSMDLVEPDYLDRMRDRGIGAFEAISQIFPSQDHEGSELEESEEVFELTLIAGDDTAVILQPCEQALDLPPTPVPAQHPPILSLRLPAVGPARRNLCHPQPCALFVQWVAVVGLVANETLGPSRRQTSVDQSEYIRGFVRRGATRYSTDSFRQENLWFVQHRLNACG